MLDEFPVARHGTALYYPYIHIQDVDWLKLALLYWDGLRRIVPNDVRTNDSHQVEQIVGAGLLCDTVPENYTRAAEEKFMEAISPFIEIDPSPAAIRIQNYVKTLEGDVLPVDSIYDGKMTYRLREKLVSLGIANVTVAQSEPTSFRAAQNSNFDKRI